MATYHAVGSIDEALDVLGAHGDDAKVLAGGQSLVSDATASADYRRRMVVVFVRRGLEHGYGRAGRLSDGTAASGLPAVTC